MPWGQPRPPCEGIPITWCTQEGTLSVPLGLVKLAFIPFENISGALHEKRHLYIRLRATIRPLGSDSFSEDWVGDAKDPGFCP